MTNKSKLPKKQTTPLPNKIHVHKEDAVKLIRLQEEFSDKTGNPCMLDVVGSTEEAMKKFITFAADVTEAPILVDSPSIDVKAAGVKHAAELGLEKRVVYNSLMHARIQTRRV